MEAVQLERSILACFFLDQSFLKDIDILNEDDFKLWKEESLKAKLVR